MEKSNLTTKLTLLIMPLLLAIAACGGSPNQEEAISDVPQSARVIVIDVQVSADGNEVESITVRKGNGEELLMRLSEASCPPTFPYTWVSVKLASSSAHQ